MCQQQDSDGASLWEEKACPDCPMTNIQPEVVWRGWLIYPPYPIAAPLASSPSLLLCCCCSCVSVPPLPNLFHLLPALFTLPPPCLVPVVLLLLIPGNELLLVIQSSLQKIDAHPTGQEEELNSSHTCCES